MAISTNLKSTIYRNLYQNTGPAGGAQTVNMPQMAQAIFCVVHVTDDGLMYNI